MCSNSSTSRVSAHEMITRWLLRQKKPHVTGCCRITLPKVKDSAGKIDALLWNNSSNV